jgi:hypothetical protein
MLKNTFCDAVFPLEELYARPMHQSSMHELCERQTPQVKPPPSRYRAILKSHAILQLSAAPVYNPRRMGGLQ